MKVRYGWISMRRAEMASTGGWVMAWEQVSCCTGFELSLEVPLGLDLWGVRGEKWSDRGWPWRYKGSMLWMGRFMVLLFENA